MYEGSLCGKWDVILPRDRTKFVELANKRVSRALKAIQLVGNLSNRSSYDYTEEDVSKIFKALEDEMTDCRKRFDRAGKSKAAVCLSSNKRHCVVFQPSAICFDLPTSRGAFGESRTQHLPYVRKKFIEASEAVSLHPMHGDYA